MAAAIAFYSFFSLFPLAFLTLLAFDLFVGNAAGQEEQVNRIISTFIPVSQDVVNRSIDSAAGSRQTIGPLALIGLIWASTAVFATLRKGINTAWNVWIPRPFLKERVIDLTLTTMAGLLFMGLVIAMTVVRTYVETDDLSSSPGLLTSPVWLTASSFGVTFFAFMLLYRFLPNRPVHLSDVVFGALIGAVALSAVLGIFALLQRDLDGWSFETLLTALFVSAASLLIMANVAGLEKRSVGYLLISGMGLLAALVALPVFLFALWLDVDGDGLWRFGASLETISVLAGHTSLLSLRQLSAQYRWLKPIATVLGGALAALVISMIWADDLGEGKLRAAGVLSILLLSVTIVIPILSRLVVPGDPERTGRETRSKAGGQRSDGVRYCPNCGRAVRASGENASCGECGARFAVKFDSRYY
ncbi:MAG: YihY/virulence factor BrkB family protein [Chloroflexi bacterium]|nr:YihY/virulence factor BrkB family protein [Chloroflexota bacterium]